MGVKKITSMKNQLSIHHKIYLKANPHLNLLVWENTPRELTWEDSYGVPGSEWNEPALFKKDDPVLREYAYLPFISNDFDDRVLVHIGTFFDGDKWEKIPGYRPPCFAPGTTWVDEYLPYTFKHMLKECQEKAIQKRGRTKVQKNRWRSLSGFEYLFDE